mmetsp:Transcript_266/g.593  ORF Transcript_266/g.593 Transcript_266/m.593 type:complete len:102 (+) Transcript_266:65-370(+)
MTTKTQLFHDFDLSSLDCLDRFDIKRFLQRRLPDMTIDAGDVDFFFMKADKKGDNVIDAEEFMAAMSADIVGRLARWKMMRGVRENRNRQSTSSSGVCAVM